MVDLLGAPISLVNITGWAAFSLLVWVIARALIKGDLRTAREVEELRADRDARLTEAGSWKGAFEERGRALQTVLAQNHRLLELSETSAHVLTSLPTTDVEGGKS